ncbi:hypothetical protein GOP47_0009219 [Adiantum capillus-veneris]|uniref:Cyclin-dependent kinase inhibitor domain-containing protein n=1 Tax=Adiantum capillus-veneris TaxID=13818 RepID=A0A9D4ZH02_ADICA|nr:hypothetical protein GOP47_0009219 [Adiantum capillus-veneris]
MGKYMKKARGGRGAMEVMTQGPLGVRTRARTQAMQKEVSISHSSNAKVSTSTSIQSLIPAQISYLELRSRRLEKVVGCMSNKLPASRKSSSAGEFRRLSDLTKTDILADDSSSPRLAISIDGAQHRRRQTRHQTLDENQQAFYHHCHGDNEAEELSLQGFVQSSLQQWTSRGRAPPGVAHSRSNSRSNSMTRELPPSKHQLPPHGILTRNQRKLEKQFSEASGCSKFVHMEVEVDASCSAKACGLDKASDVEISYGENPMEEVWSAGNRLAREGSPRSHERDRNTVPFDADTTLLPEHQQTPPTATQSPFNMEIEDFFLQAEQQEQRRFIDRYNFDPQSDRPLPGRYDWVAL